MLNRQHQPNFSNPEQPSISFFLPATGLLSQALGTRQVQRTVVTSGSGGNLIYEMDFAHATRTML